MPGAMKKCTKCQEEKPLSDFFPRKDTKDLLTYYCRKCTSLINRDWDKRNPAKRREYGITRRLGKYAITQNEFKELLDNQQGCCAICMTPIESDSKGHIDHDHKSGFVRGILCGSCNRAIGLLKDDYFIISEAAAYLQNFEELQGELT